MGADNTSVASAQKGRQINLTRTRSVSKNNSSFGSGADLPYNGLGNSQYSTNSNKVSALQVKNLSNKPQKIPSSVKKAKPRKSSRLVAESFPNASTSSLMSFNNDTTMIGIAQNQSQSKILNHSSLSEKQEENPFSNSLLKKSVKQPSKTEQRNVSTILAAFNDYSESRFFESTTNLPRVSRAKNARKIPSQRS